MVARLEFDYCLYLGDGLIQNVFLDQVIIVDNYVVLTAPLGMFTMEATWLNITCQLQKLLKT